MTLLTDYLVIYLHSKHVADFNIVNLYRNNNSERRAHLMCGTYIIFAVYARFSCT